MRAIEPTHQVQVARNGRVIWGIVAVMMVAVVLGNELAGLSIDTSIIAKIAGLILMLIAIAYFYRRWRVDPWISFGAESCAQIVAILALGAFLMYPLATIGLPYRDAELHAIDLWMGLDWEAYLRFVNAHPLLCFVSKLAYSSMAVQYAFTIFVLVASSRFLRIQQYVVAVAVALAITLAVFTFTPSIGTYAFLKIQPESYARLDPVLTFNQMYHLDAMRTHSWSVIHELEGLISFPSFHTVSAVLFTWALYPIRKLRLWVAVLNVALVISAPLQGAHYFVDILGGIATATLALCIVSSRAFGYSSLQRTEPSKEEDISLEGSPNQNATDNLAQGFGEQRGDHANQPSGAFDRGMRHGGHIHLDRISCGSTGQTLRHRP